MSYKIVGYKPESVFNYFEELTKIPHGSGNEEKIADYLENFAQKNKIWYRRDANNNIFMKKEASDGYEDKDVVMLQGHMDMVCEKNSDYEHDFLNDPLDIYVEKGWLKARGTTLGGDDGIAVAMIMAVLTDNELLHPKLECLITTEEETGMGGANAFDCSDVEAVKLINLDSEEEGIVTVGCAGGARVSMDCSFERIPAQNKCVKIKLTGLAGGHSGAEIHLPRKNAVILMGRVLMKVYENMPFNLISLCGGNKDNAIPRECEAVISSCDIEHACEIVKAAEKEIKKELGKDDKAFKLICSRAKICTERMLTFKDTYKMISFIEVVPNGVYTYSPYIDGFVESSNNLGIARVEENSAHFDLLCRSSAESLLDVLLSKFRALSKIMGFDYGEYDRYPAWQLIPDSPLQKLYIEAVKNVCDGIEPKVSIIHAGLECGVLKEKIPHDIDAVSIGPNMKNIHTPGEALELSSCERTWKILEYMLMK